MSNGLIPRELAASSEQERKKNKRVRIYAGRKVCSWGINYGDEVRIEMLNGDDVMVVYDSSGGAK